MKTYKFALHKKSVALTSVSLQSNVCWVDCANVSLLAGDPEVHRFARTGYIIPNVKGSVRETRHLVCNFAYLRLYIKHAVSS